MLCVKANLCEWGRHVVAFEWNAIRVAKILREVPSWELPAAPHRQGVKQRIRSGPFHPHLVKHWKRHIELIVRKVTRLDVTKRLLGKIIGGEGQNRETPLEARDGGKASVELLELRILCVGEAAHRRHIHDEQHGPLVLLERYLSRALLNHVIEDTHASQWIGEKMRVRGAPLRKEKGERGRRSGNNSDK